MKLEGRARHFDHEIYLLAWLGLLHGEPGRAFSLRGVFWEREGETVPYNGERMGKEAGNGRETGRKELRCTG